MNTYDVVTTINVEASILCNRGVNLKIYETKNVVCKGNKVIVTSYGGGNIKDKLLYVEFELVMEIDLNIFDKIARKFLKHNDYDGFNVAKDSVKMTFYTPLDKDIIVIDNSDDLIYGFYINLKK